MVANEELAQKLWMETRSKIGEAYDLASDALPSSARDLATLEAALQEAIARVKTLRANAGRL
jgi:hypothetical protein